MEESERQCSRKSARNEVTLRTGVPTNHIAPLSSPLIYRIHVHDYDYTTWPNITVQ
jgi:hypothetical protein